MEVDRCGSIIQISKEFSNISDSVLIEQVQLLYHYSRSLKSLATFLTVCS